MKGLTGYRRRRETMSHGLLLIGIGVLFLLMNFGLLPRDFWNVAVTFWPLILVLMGVGLFFRQCIPFSLVLLLFLAAVAVLSLWSVDTSVIHHYRGVPRDIF
jgi:hypothetical protein